MNTPKPAMPNAVASRPMSLEDSARALAELHRQMQVLNTQLEYLSLLLRLGVR